MQNFSYHVHTNFSDGQNNLSQMLAQAVALGWTEIGITDHLIIHKNINKSLFYPILVKNNQAPVYWDDFKTALDDIQRHGEYFRRTAAQFPLKVYLGYEVDYFTYDGWIDEFKQFIPQVDYDYLISGNHFFTNENGLEVFNIYHFDENFHLFNHTNFEPYFKRHYQTMIKAVQSGMFSFLAHIDFARKSMFHEQYSLVDERLAVVKSLAEYQVSTELSTKGLRKIGDFYPEKNILESVIKHNIPVVISDDAHSTQELGYGFEQAEELLKQLNCRKRFVLQNPQKGF